MDFDDNESFEPDGLTVNGKYLLNSNWYLNGEYSFFEEGSFDFDMLTLGAGYRLPVNATTDAYFGANLERIDVDDGEATFKVGANYYITPQWAVGANYKVIDDLDIMQVTARYAF